MACSKLNVTDMRDSYAHRIDYDLSEVILQYLPLKDKLRLECVSWMFKRTIFQKQFDLIMIRDRIENIESKLLKNRHFAFGAFHNLLMKCTNLRVIKIGWMEYFICQYDDILALITKHCNNLTELECPQFAFHKNVFKRFIEKFGSRILTFKVYSSVGGYLAVEKFPKLKDLTLTEWFPYKNLYTMKPFLEIEIWSKLERLEVYNIYDVDDRLFMQIPKCKSLRSLALTFVRSRNCDLETLKSITSLKELRNLELWGVLKQNPDIKKAMKDVANNCTNLKRIDIALEMGWPDNHYMEQFLLYLKPFLNLKRLKLRFATCSEIGNGRIGLFNFHVFDGFQQITHLTLCSYLHIESRNFERILQGIERKLPNLEHFEITLNFKIPLAKTGKFVAIMKRLPRLRVLKLRVKSYFSGLKLGHELTENCPNLTTLEVKAVFE